MTPSAPRAVLAALALAMISGLTAPAAAQEPELPPAVCLEIPGQGETIPYRNDRCPTWVRSHAAATGLPTPAAVTPDGERVLIAATAGDTFEGLSNITTAAYDTDTGEPLWTRVYEGPEEMNDFATALTLSPDGSTAFVAGAQDVPKQFAPETGGEIVTVAIDTATGQVRWSAESLRGTAVGIAASADAVVVTGSNEGDIVTAAYDPGTGAQRWIRRHDGDGHGEDTPGAIAVAGDRVVVTGTEWAAEGPEMWDPADDRNMVTLAYDGGTGAELWRRIDDSGAAEWSWEEGNAILASPDGSTVYVSGRSHFTAHSALVAIDAADGEARWRRLLGFSSLTGIAVSPGGDRVLMTGFASNAQFSGDRTRAFDAATGQTLWQTQFLDNDDGGWGPYAYDVVVSPDGTTVYVTGTERRDFPPLTWDSVTTAYDMRDGETLWYAEYNSSRINNDITLTRDVAIAPDGQTLFTSGAFLGPEFGATQRGWGVLAYATDDAGPLAGGPAGAEEPCPGRDGGARLPILCIPGPPSLDLAEPPATTGGGGELAPCPVPVMRDRCESWVGTYDTPWNHGGAVRGLDVPMASAVSPAGNGVYVTGATIDMESDTQAIATAAFDPVTGERRWSRLHIPSFRPYAQPFGIAVSPDGSTVFVTGVSHYDAWIPARGSFTTIAYDAATGELLWDSAYHGTVKALNMGMGVTVSPDGEHVFATGLRDGVTTNYDQLANTSGQLTTISYDADTGEREWIRAYGSEGAVGPGLGHAIAVTSDGGAVVVTGPSERGADHEAVTIAYRAAGQDAGEQLWLSRHDQPNDDVPLAVEARGDRVYTAGWHVDDPATGATSMTTTSLDAATGIERWSRSYGTTSEPAYATGLAVAPDGNVYVTGYAVNRALWGGATVAYDPAGTERWATREPTFAPPDLLYMTDPLAVSPDGSTLYLGGQEEVDTQVFGYLRSDVVTRAYGTGDGEPVWTGRYNASQTETNIFSAVGVGLSPDGRSVYTSAWFSYNPSEDGNGEDYGLLAYSVAA